MHTNILVFTICFVTSTNTENIVSTMRILSYGTGYHSVYYIRPYVAYIDFHVG
jgi:hypothetical protein